MAMATVGYISAETLYRQRHSAAKSRDPRKPLYTSPAARWHPVERGSTACGTPGEKSFDPGIVTTPGRVHRPSPLALHTRRNTWSGQIGSASRRDRECE